MVFRLANPAARLSLVAFAFLFALALSFFSVRNAFAAHDADLRTAAGYEKATRLEPGNFENWYLFGRYWQYSLEEPNPSRAIENYGTALALNPQSSETWLDLATLYESENRPADAINAFLRAKHAYPLSAEVSWRYGNFLLRQGTLTEAYTEIRRAVYVDPLRSAEAFSRCWQVDPNIHAILDDVLPPNRDAYLDVIRELLYTARLDDALVVWDRLVSLHPGLQMAEIIALTDALLQHQQFDDAARVWSDALTLSGDLPPLDPSSSAVWDGGFETRVRGGGLAWSFSPTPRGVKANVDTAEKHSGHASLRLDFDGKRNVSFDAVCTNAIVRPATRYQFSAWVRAQRLTTDQGIRFRISWTENSAYNSVETSDVHGNEPWTQVQMPWTSPKDLHQVRICVVRDTSGKVDSQIQGTAWVDDVSLTARSQGQPTP